MKTRISQQVFNAGTQATRSISSAGQRPGAHHPPFTIFFFVTHGKTAGHHIDGEKKGRSQAQRFEYEGSHCGLVRLPGDFLDDAPQQVKPGIAVRKMLSRLKNLRHIRQFLDEAGQGVISIAGLLIGLLPPAATMRQEVLNREFLSRLPVCQAQFRNDVYHTGFQGQPPLLDQVHDQRRCVRLPDAAEQKKRVIRDG